jgi:hypothetical protein
VFLSANPWILFIHIDRRDEETHGAYRGAGPGGGNGQPQEFVSDGRHLRSGHGLDSFCPDSEQVATVAAVLGRMRHTVALEEAAVYYTSSDAVGWPRAYMAYLKSHPDEEVSAASFFAEEEAAQQAAGANV